MPRIRLAHWHDGHAPGDEITVDDDTLRALQVDGRVNAVLPSYDDGGVLPTAVVSEFANETGEPMQVIPAPRKRKATPEE